MLSHIDQFTDEQLMEQALSKLRLEICMVIEQMPSQPTSYTKLAAVTYQIEQSQREVQRESTLQAGLPQNPGEICPVVAMAMGAAVSTVTTRVDVTIEEGVAGYLYLQCSPNLETRLTGQGDHVQGSCDLHSMGSHD